MKPNIPSLRFDNRTEFDALHFDTIDQNGVAFHVIVAKMGYRLVPGELDGMAQLVPTDEPLLLYDQDHHHDDDVEKSVRVESDLAPYKPACDVVIVGDACPPDNAKVQNFSVSLRVSYADTSAPIPERPRPLNPLQALSTTQFEEWRQQVAIAERSRIPGKVLIDKKLNVFGKRYLRRRAAPVRMIAGLLRAASLGMIKPSPWRITSAEPAVAIPLRYESALGGECRIERASGLTGRIPKKYRLTEERAENYPASTDAPEAHDSSQHNPTGCGFSRSWYLDATRASTLPAPRIEYADQPFNTDLFWKIAKGYSDFKTAGMGFVGRGWLPRRQLVGTVDAKADWQEDEIPLLPKDFDYRYWNGAPDDQQCSHMAGGEEFTLTNLCRPGSRLGSADAHGNCRLKFALPQQSLFVMGTTEEGAVLCLPLVIDTVIIDMEAEQLELVWRLAIVAGGDFEEVRLIHATEPEQLTRLNDWLAAQLKAVPQSNTAQTA